MATKQVDFTEILIRQGMISADQLAEAKRVAKTSGKKVADHARASSAMPPAKK